MCNYKRIRIRNKNGKRQTVDHFTPRNSMVSRLKYLQRYNTINSKIKYVGRETRRAWLRFYL